MTSSAALKANIWKYYLFIALTEFAFATPIVQLFYLANNLTVLRIAMLGVVWTITKMIVEIPSSVLADRWSRKGTLLLSSTFAMLSLLLMILATNYYFFVAASFCSAVSFAFMSGTDVAFFYDTTKALKQEKKFDKLWAKQQIYKQGPLILAFVSSGFLYRISPKLPFQLSLAFLALSFLVLLSLKEPSRHKSVDEDTVFTHFKRSAKFIFKDKHLRAMLFFIMLFCLGSDYSYGYGQIYLNYLALPVVFFGIVYVIKSFMVTISTNVAPAFRRKYGYQKVFALEMILITALFYLMVFTNNYWIGALGFILIAIPHGLFMVTKSSYMHARIASHNRATVDSMYSFILAAGFLILEPLAGYLTDLFSIKIPFFAVAIAMTLYSIYYVAYGSKQISAS